MTQKPTTKVVNIKRPFDVYIGRPGPWGNPFFIGRDGTREAVVKKYESWFRARPDLMARAKSELKGKTLGCYCKPLPCHGDVLAKYADEE